MKKVVIIGGGPGGLAAAKEAARLGGTVTLIEQDRAGGRAMWHSLIPSKVWLSAMNLLDDSRHGAEKGIDIARPQPNPRRITARIAELSAQLGEQELAELQSLDVRVINGSARFVSPTEIVVSDPSGNTQSLTADVFIIATGSVPIFPEGIRPDGKRIIAPRLMGKLNTIPESLIMIGGGVTGSEFIYMFNALGSRVTAVTDVAQLLPRCDEDISQTLENILRDRGVQFIKNTAVKSVENTGDAVRVTLANGETLQADYAFIAIGRRPDVDKLDPAAAGIRIGNAGEVVVDEFLRSAQPHVYAVGDVTGAPMIANRAMAQGRLAARHAMNAKASPAPLYVEAIYTNPEVAQIGLREAAARQTIAQLQVYRADFATLQKAQISGHSEGFCKVLVNRETDQIVGAAGIGNHIADVMESIAVAMKARLPFAELRDIAPANPTISEIILNLREADNNPTPPSI